MNEQITKRSRISRHIAIFLALFMVIALWGNSVLANAPMYEEYVEFKVIGIPEDSEWFVEILAEDEYDIQAAYESSDAPADFEMQSDFYLSGWGERLGEEYSYVDQKIEDLAASEGLSRTEQKSHCSKNKYERPGRFEWSPVMELDSYRIAVYLPEYDRLLLSDSVDQLQKFDHILFDCSDMENGVLKVYPKDPTMLRVIDFVTRLIFTVVVETLLALAFDVKEKDALAYIAIVNLITNLSMNLILNRFGKIGWSSHGEMIYTEIMIFLEIMVFLIEGILYLCYKKRGVFESSGKTFLFSFVANLITGIAGFWIFFYFDGLIW